MAITGAALGYMDDQRLSVSVTLMKTIAQKFVEKVPSSKVAITSFDHRVVWAPGLVVKEADLISTKDLFINVQQSESEPDVHDLVDRAVELVVDLCMIQRVGLNNPYSYVVLRVPHILIKSPSGAHQLTFQCGIHTETAGRDLGLYERKK